MCVCTHGCVSVYVCVGVCVYVSVYMLNIATCCMVYVVLVVLRDFFIVTVRCRSLLRQQDINLLYS